MVVVGAQSCTVYVGGSALGQQGTAQGGALGLFVALLFLVGGAFARPFPLVSFLAFLAAGLLGLAGGTTTAFTDLTLWAIASLGLAILSFLSIREKRRASAQNSRVT
jgi:hypothetical protein